ncbi:cytochrome P450 [Congregibacter sp.]|uniref:cytochrome P450 n=1 Tax=Congregibacter sp. TaxID=2744308 RepID=UPI0038587DC3
MSQDKHYIPPKPHSLAALPALMRVLWNGDGNLLDLLPAAAYRFPVGNLGYSRRSTVLFNDPDLVRHIMRDPDGIFPKSDLMVNALEHLIGESIFVTDGEKWRRQRAMIDPAFSHMRISHAFEAMQAAVNDYVHTLEASADSGEPLSLDLAMSQLTADIICRTVFSTSLDSQVAHDVFEDFTVFERSVAQVDIKRLIFEPAWTKAPQPQVVLDACTRIRSHLAALIDTHLAPDADYNDIASAVVAARDSDTQEPFTKDELIDQLGVFFLAGHETTASVLTWLFFICAQRPTLVAQMREEIDRVTGIEGGGEVEGATDGKITFEHMRQLPLLKAVFREALRLYPPITFMPRVAMEDTTVGPRKLPKGALVMISPWTLHRNGDYWENPHAFKPERFLQENESALTNGAYIPFGQGPHTCVGAGFAQTESLLIIAELLRRFDFEALNPNRVRPAARLTTRPREQIFCRVTRRSRS